MVTPPFPTGGIRALAAKKKYSLLMLLAFYIIAIDRFIFKENTLVYKEQIILSDIP
jgi:hypothetical protein